MSGRPDSERQDLADWYARRPLAWYQAGEEVADGPLPVAGCYVDPYCHPLCCRPNGPFPSRLAAEGWCDAVAKAVRDDDAAEEQRLLRAADALAPRQRR